MNHFRDIWPWRRREPMRLTSLLLSADDEVRPTAARWACWMLLFAVLYAFIGAPVPPFAKPLQALGGDALDPEALVRALVAWGLPLESTLPVTVIEIDDSTYSEWGQPPITPRDKLAQLIENIAARKPRGIVVDILLSAAPPDKQAAPVDQALIDIVRDYHGEAPLLWMQDLHLDPTSQTLIRESHLLDNIARTNNFVAFSQAYLSSDDDDILRHYMPYVRVCIDGQVRHEESPPLRLAAMMQMPDSGPQSAKPLEVTETCALADLPTRLITFGPRYSHRPDLGLVSGVPKLSALLVLEEPETLDASLFEGRVVLIGNTHWAAGDQWSTPVGDMTGLEVLANIIRFSPLDDGTTLRHRTVALVMFLLLCCLAFLLRPAVALAIGFMLILAGAYVLMRILNWPRVTQSAADAVMLFIEFKALDLILVFAKDIRTLGLRAVLSRRFTNQVDDD